MTLLHPTLLPLYCPLNQVKRRQTLTRVQLDLWREAESSSQSALKRAGEEAARLVKRSVSVDPGEAECQV